jgi:PAS domain S-box-containing protein
MMDLYQAVFENAPDPILFVDQGGLILQINARAEKAFGYAHGELIGRAVEILIPRRFEAAHQRHRAGFMAAPRTRPMGSGLELFARRKDGSEFPVDVMLSAAGAPGGMIAIAIIRDLTESKRMDARMRELHERLRLSAEAADMGYWTFNEGTGELTFDGILASLLGGRPEDFPDAESARQRIVAEDREFRRRRIRESIDAKGRYEIEYRVAHPDGSIHWLKDLGRRIGGSASARLIAGVTFDVTDRKAAEARAEEARIRERELFDLAPIGIFMADIDGLYTDVNAAGCRIVGLPREGIIGKSILDFIPREDAERLSRSKAALLAGGNEVSEWPMRRGDGSYVDVEVNTKIYPDGRWQAFARDVTERKESERRQAELIRKLRESRKEIKALQGMLPICAYCKRIRDDRGAWEQMESYIGKRTEAEFSHSICPDCMAEHFPGYLSNANDAGTGG